MKPRHLFVLSAALVATAPAAHAVSVEAAAFAGTFTTTCTLPLTVEGPADGPYSCRHSARSAGCAAVADTGVSTTYVRVCRADLTSGTTSGSATAVAPPSEAWTCANGAGTGTFRYQPSVSEPAVFSFPVNLVVVGSEVVVSGSYTQAGTGRHIVVRAQFPAVCAASTSAGGYTGTVTAV